MSILDSAMADMRQIGDSMPFASEVLSRVTPNLDEKTRTLIEATNDGTSLDTVLGITKEQKKALLDMGCRLIQAGEPDKAMDVLLRLYTLDPLQEGALYAMGLICQMRGDLKKAVFLYIQFLALDATNPLGYLRLGECLVSARDYPEAFSALDTARVFAAEGKGQPGTLAEVERLLALPEVEAAGKALKH